MLDEERPIVYETEHYKAVVSDEYGVRMYHVISNEWDVVEAKYHHEFEARRACDDLNTIKACGFDVEKVLAVTGRSTSDTHTPDWVKDLM